MGIKATAVFNSLLLLAVLCLGCSNNGTKPEASDPSASPATAPAPAKAESKVDECGKYEVDVELPEQYACETDADCGWTGRRPGSCTDALCKGHYVAGNKAWIAAAAALHERFCSGAEFGYCVRVRCRNIKPTGAVCTDGRCQLVHAD